MNSFKQKISDYFNDINSSDTYLEKSSEEEIDAYIEKGSEEIGVYLEKSSKEELNKLLMKMLKFNEVRIPLLCILLSVTNDILNVYLYKVFIIKEIINLSITNPKLSLVLRYSSYIEDAIVLYFIRGDKQILLIKSIILLTRELISLSSYLLCNKKSFLKKLKKEFNFDFSNQN